MRRASPLQLISLCILLAFASCSDSHKPNEEPVQFGDALAVRMERMGCYGQCPIYILDVRPDGLVTFDGKGYTKTIGVADTRISQEQLQELISAVRESDFFGFNDSYQTEADGCPTISTDMPTVILRVRLGDREKTVAHYHGCLEIPESQPVEPGKVRRAEELQPYPKKLTALEDRIDEILASKQWVSQTSQ